MKLFYPKKMCYSVAIKAFRVRPPWLVTMRFDFEFFDGSSAGHSCNKFVVQVYFTPFVVKSFGERMATVSGLPALSRLRASSVSLRPICA